jgi:Trypsin-like peptidase domain
MNRFATFLIAVIFAALRFSAFADDAAEAGRRVLSKNQDAVVTVKLVVAYSVSYSGRDQQSESKTEAVGTVIDPSGLTVISLTAIDPSAMMKARMRSAQADLKIESEVKDTKIVLADGTEFAAEVALRDKDLDVVFLRPTEKPAKPFAAIDLTKAAKPQILDQVICLNRLGKVANRVASVSIERIDALIERPRPFYVLGYGGSSGVGSPVFAASGALVGIILIRNAPADGEANVASLFSGGSGSLGILPVVVPAADLVEDAKQAMEAKKPASTEQK